MPIIKVAIISDPHFDINSRWEETIRVTDFFADDICRREVNVALCAGDFGPLIPIRQFKPVERMAVARFAKKITDHCPFDGVRGNHDVFMDLAIFNELETKYPLRIMEVPEVHVVTANNGAQIAIAGMPWPIKAELLARLDKLCGCECNAERGTCPAPCENRGLSPEQKDEITANLMRNVFLGMGAQLRALKMPSILLMHAMVRASRVSTGQPIAPGQDFEIGQEDLGLVGADFTALGHVHMAQEWEWNSATIAYCGSPRRTNWGETEQKSYILLEIDTDIINASPGDQIKWSRIPIPCTPMILHEATWGCDEGEKGEDPFCYYWKEISPVVDVTGAEVRFRYRTPSDFRAGAKEAAERERNDLIRRGAVDVKVEEVVIQTARARVEEITTAQTVKEKLQVLWKSRDDIPTPARQEQLFSKLSEIERQVQSET